MKAGSSRQLSTRSCGTLPFRACAPGDGVTGLALVEAVRMAESRLMLADNDDLF
jgi:hypothetical protein